jgi:hypothetical protein
MQASSGFQVSSINLDPRATHGILLAPVLGPFAFVPHRMDGSLKASDLCGGVR